MVKNRLKHELDGMIGEDQLFHDHQKQMIFTKIQTNTTTQTNPRRFNVLAVGMTMAVVSIFIVLILSQTSLAPNMGNQPTQDAPMINDDIDEHKENNAFPEEEVYDSIALSDDLFKIYNQYAQTYDDTLLEGLEPFDIFRLYHQAKFDSDDRTIYELYYKEDELQFFPYDSFEEYVAEIPQGVRENEEDYNKRMMKVNRFVEGRLSNKEAYVKFDAPSGGHLYGFHIVKNSHGIWKIPFMPIQ